MTTCDKCGEALEVGMFPFCPHGYPGHAFAAIGEEIVGGFVQENFGPTPETFYSKHAMALRAKELGLEPRVRHMGIDGTDKSPHTSRWI